MAQGYTNFIGTAWSASVLTALKENCFLTDFCVKEYEGEVKRNSQIKINGVERPTIGDYTGADIGTPEVVDDSQVILKIDQAKYFNVLVDDVNKAQMKPELMQVLTKEAGIALSATADKVVAKEIATNATKLTSVDEINTADLVQKQVDAAILKLYENNVSLNTQLELVLSPGFYQLFRTKITELSTDNVELIKKGIVGRYNNALVKMSNLLDKTVAAGYTSCFVRTNRAVAYAEQIDEVEAYRPQGLFADAVKGLHVYGTKVVRPDEIVVFPMRTDTAS